MMTQRSVFHISPSLSPKLWPSSPPLSAGHADIGFAHDADGERLGIVTELGEPQSEEMGFSLATDIRLQAKMGTVVTNVSTTSAIEKIAARYGGTVVRTPVGQTYISEGIIEHDGVLGGEGSGGITVPEVHATHDSVAAIGLILEHLARTGRRISQLIQQVPRLAVLKHNISIEPNRLYSVLQDFRGAVEREQLRYDMTDGIKVVLTDGWIHARASNTESMIRIIVEADDAARSRGLLDWARDRLKR